jgi:hypothetical protein
LGQNAVDEVVDLLTVRTVFDSFQTLANQGLCLKINAA